MPQLPAIYLDFGGVWSLLSARLRAIPEYVTRFADVFADINGAADITYAHAANAIAAFEEQQWRFDDSPFDHCLRGNKGSMTMDQIRGIKLFYGKAGCPIYHSGKFQTDHNFHAIVMPQIGPGKGATGGFS